MTLKKATTRKKIAAVGLIILFISSTSRLGRASDAGPSEIQKGQGLPIGYHEERLIRPGFFWTGASILAITYGVGIAMAANAGMEGGSAWLVLPVVGPWGALAVVNQPGNYRCDFRPVPECNGDVRPFLVLDGVSQGLGAALLAVGLLVRERHWVRDRSEIAVFPAVHRTSASLTIVKTF
jgi:hypothetical protein